MLINTKWRSSHMSISNHIMWWHNCTGPQLSEKCDHAWIMSCKLLQRNSLVAHSATRPYYTTFGDYQGSISFSHLVLWFGDDGGTPFSLHCMHLVYHGYICRALVMIDIKLDQLPLSRNGYIKMFDYCKHMAFFRAKQVHELERYLGNNSFEGQPFCSGDDFLTRVRAVFSFQLYRIGGECPALSPM